MRLGGTRRELQYCKIHAKDEKKNTYVAKCESRKLCNEGKLWNWKQKREREIVIRQHLLSGKMVEVHSRRKEISFAILHENTEIFERRVRGIITDTVKPQRQCTY